MLAEWVFKLCEPELHLQYLWREGFAETERLFGGLPVREVCRGAGGILDDNIFDPILQATCPGEQAFDARRIGRDHADCCKSHAGFSYIVVHRLKPVGCDLPGTCAHVGKNDRRTTVEMIDKGIEACRGMNVDLGHSAVEKVFQRATRLVLCI